MLMISKAFQICDWWCILVTVQIDKLMLIVWLVHVKKESCLMYNNEVPLELSNMCTLS